MNKGRCAYCPHFRDEETGQEKLVAGTWVLNWTPGPEQAFCPSSVAVMTKFCSCLHMTQFRQLKQHEEPIHHQVGIAPEHTGARGAFSLPGETFEGRTDPSPVFIHVTQSPITKAPCSFVLFTEQFHFVSSLGSHGDFVGAGTADFTEQELGCKSAPFPHDHRATNRQGKITVPTISPKQSTPRMRAGSPTLAWPGDHCRD